MRLAFDDNLIVTTHFDPEMAMLADPSALARAKKLGDLPVGRHELPNGVSVYITWDSTASGELVSRLKFVREDSTEEAK